jgi:hypothetical protein
LQQLFLNRCNSDLLTLTSSVFPSLPLRIGRLSLGLLIGVLLVLSTFHLCLDRIAVG